MLEVTVKVWGSMQSVLKKKKKGCSGKDLQKRKVLKSGMKERVGDGKLIIISMTVSGVNDRVIHSATPDTTQTGQFCRVGRRAM